MTAKWSELYKEGKVIFAIGPEHGQTAELEILVDDGPLCVAGVWNWAKKEKVQGLHFVYFKRLGLHFGPYYAGISLAAKDMRKALKAFPERDFWTQSLDWYRRQAAFHRWVEKNMGRPGDLVGGRWAPEEKAEK